MGAELDAALRGAGYLAARVYLTVAGTTAPTPTAATPARRALFLTLSDR